MKPTPNLAVERHRLRYGPLASNRYDGNNGAFIIPNPHGPKGVPSRLTVLVSDGMGWDHVSVHARDGRGDGNPRIPTWVEMCYVKDLFFDPEECVVQYHPRRSVYRNAHEHVLHLWRPQDATLPEPNPDLVGPPPGESEDDVRRRYGAEASHG